MIDDTVKEILRAARDAKTIETCEGLRHRVAASVALLRAMDREPRSYLMERLRAHHAGADRNGNDSLLGLLREAFGESTARQVTKDGFT